MAQAALNGLDEILDAWNEIVIEGHGWLDLGFAQEATECFEKACELSDAYCLLLAATVPLSSSTLGRLDNFVLVH